MQEKQNLPTYLITRIWFMANCVLGILFFILAVIEVLSNSNSGDSLGIYFAAIFIGLFISTPSLIKLMIANNAYNKNRFPDLSIKQYTAVVIAVINVLYLIFTFIYVEISVDCIIFYIITTAAGLGSLYFLTKNYKPENEF